MEDDEREALRVRGREVAMRIADEATAGLPHVSTLDTYLMEHIVGAEDPIHGIHRLLDGMGVCSICGEPYLWLEDGDVQLHVANGEHECPTATFDAEGRRTDV